MISRLYDLHFRQGENLLSLPRVVVCADKTLSKVSLSMAEALMRVSAAYAAPATSTDRAQAWQTVVTLLTDVKCSVQDKKLAQQYLTTFVKQMTPDISPNDNLSTLIQFLKKFSKQESITLLAVWIQTQTNPQVPNSRYDAPEVFFKTRTGDCSEVAWLAQNVLSALGIQAEATALVYRFDYSLKMFTTGHAFVRCSFIEGDTTFQYILDNSQLLAVPVDQSWKKTVWETYGDVVWKYRTVDPEKWRLLKPKEDDPQLWITDSFTVYSFVDRSVLLDRFMGLELSTYFDNPQDERLFFKDNFAEIVKTEQVQGHLSVAQVEALLKLYHDSENTGTTLY